MIAGVAVQAQTAIKKGAVNYEMKVEGNDESAAMMGESTISIQFDEKNQATTMNMMGGMMTMKTITPFENLKDSKMTVEVMGSKYEIIELGEEALKANKSFGNLENATEIIYDKKDIKEFAGYKCYKANVKMNDGNTSEFYITEAIMNMQPSTAKLKLAGYPLQAKVVSPQGKMTITATSFSKEISKDAFIVGEGYTKMTMEEFQKQMGGQ